MFQLSAFQRNAFQIGFTATLPPQGGGAKPYRVEFEPYHAQKAKWEDEQRELRRKQEEVKRQLEITEKRIRAIEKRRLSKLADEMLQVNLLQAMREAEELRIEYASLLQLYTQYRQEEDAIIVLLLSYPFFA